VKSRARVRHDTAATENVHTETDGTWIVQVAQATDGFWYTVDQGQPVGTTLHYVGPFASREEALEIAYYRYARPFERRT
jgi:hypothetical protein